MTAYAIPLIVGEDGFEAVRNAIANILSAEQAAQQVLATEAAEDPEQWALDVYIERSNPWENFRDDVAQFQIPIVNVWYENSSTDLQSSNLKTNQQKTTRVYVDCIGYGFAQETMTGHISGDQMAAIESQRASRLVRRILMNPKYRYLGIKSIVARRYDSDRQAFQPISGEEPVQNVSGIRISFTVDHIETIELAEAPPYERAFITVKHDPEGRVIAEMDITLAD